MLVKATFRNQATLFIEGAGLFTVLTGIFLALLHKRR
jgi:hypothetical protein